MRWDARLFVAAALMAGAVSCSSMPPPIPVGGAPESVAALAGSWNGEYFGTNTGRHGSIVFNLAAESDTAFGDVLMIPRQKVQPVSAHEASTVSTYTPPKALRISFVRASGDRVYGLLDAYRDPDCGCVLLTRFTGRIQGSEIAGIYRTQNQDSGEITTGEWRVHRKE